MHRGSDGRERVKLGKETRRLKCFELYFKAIIFLPIVSGHQGARSQASAGREAARLCGSASCSPQKEEEEAV